MLKTKKVELNKNKTAKDFPKHSVIKEWFVSGVHCIIKRSLVSFTAYIGIPIKHPLAGFDYNKLNFLSVHGGLTYGNEGNEKTIGNNGWFYYGWDYAHLGDKCHYDIPMKSLSERGAHDWTLGEVENEIQDFLYDFERLIYLTEKIKYEKTS